MALLTKPLNDGLLKNRLTAAKSMAFEFFSDNTRDEAYERIAEIRKIIKYLEKSFEKECSSIEGLIEILECGQLYAAQSKDWKIT